MSSLVRNLLFFTVSLPLLVVAIPYPTSNHGALTSVARSCGSGPTVGKAIYFLTNDEDNAVVAVPISANGTLYAGSVTATGGHGSNIIDSATNTSAAPDALAAQSSLTINGKVSQIELKDLSCHCSESDPHLEYLCCQRGFKYCQYVDNL